MNNDRIAGAAKEIKGSIKETIGKAVGDAKLQSDGRRRPAIPLRPLTLGAASAMRILHQ
jgi:hypothetical protein